MTEKKTTALDILTAALAEMTKHAMEAEAERDKAVQEADSWYKHWQKKSEELDAARAELLMVKEEYKGLNNRLHEFIAKQKGEPCNE